MRARPPLFPGRPFALPARGVASPALFRLAKSARGVKRARMSDQCAATKTVSPWLWVPTMDFAQGLPNGLLEDAVPVFFKDMGVANDRLTHALALIALPWMLKCLWSPLVDAYGTKRAWVWAAQLVFSCAFAAFALSPFAGDPVTFGLVCLSLVALCSATHDIAADGFYMLGLRQGEQSFFSGIRNTAFRLAKVFAASVVVVVAGWLIGRGATPGVAWAWALGLFAVAALALSLWHALVLPRPAQDAPAGSGRETPAEAFVEGWRTFLAKPGVGRLIAFILFYRLSEALLSALATPFLKDPVAHGGLELSTRQVGWLNGAGVVALLAGGVLGGLLVSRYGLRRMLWPMVAIMHLPNFAFLALSFWQPKSVGVIGAALLTEKFGYGFGMCAIMLYLIHVCEGPRRVTHYALCSGFMVMGAKAFTYFAGDFQLAFGYPAFFGLVIACMIPGVFVTWLVRDIPREFGRRDA